MLAVMLETPLRVLLGSKPKPLERIAAFGSSVVHASPGAGASVSLVVATKLV